MLREAWKATSRCLRKPLPLISRVWHKGAPEDRSMWRLSILSFAAASFDFPAHRGSDIVARSAGSGGGKVCGRTEGKNALRPGGAEGRRAE